MSAAEPLRPGDRVTIAGKGRKSYALVVIVRGQLTYDRLGLIPVSDVRAVSYGILARSAKRYWRHGVSRDRGKRVPLERLALAKPRPSKGGTI